MNANLVFIKDEAGAFWVSSRSLCQLVSDYTDPHRDFTNWIKNRGIPFFNEGSDYRCIANFPKEYISTSPTRNVTEYLLSFTMAIKMAEKEKPLNVGVIDQIKHFDESTASYIDLSKKPSEQSLSFIGTQSTIAKAPTNDKPSQIAKSTVSTALDASLYATAKDEVTVFDDALLGKSVSVRELHLKIAEQTGKNDDRDRVQDWFRARVEKLGLIESKDYVMLRRAVIVSATRLKVVEYNVTVKVAMRLCTNEQKQRGMAVDRFLDSYLWSLLEKAAPSPQPTEPELPFQSLTDQEQSVPTSEPGAVVGETLKMAGDFAKSIAPPRPDSGIINGPSTMPVLVSKTRLELLMEEQQRVQQEIEQTLREEEEAKQQQAATPAPEQFADVVERLNIADQRINAMERWISTFTGMIQQGAMFLAGELPVGTPDLREVTAPEAQQTEKLFKAVDFSQEPVDIREAMANTPRRKIQQLVNDYAQATTYPYNQVWCYLYEKLHNVYGFNVYKGKHSKERYIDFAERSDQLDNLLAIAQANLQPAKPVAQA